VCVCSSYGFPVTVTITVSIFFRYTVNVFQLLLLLTGITLLLTRNTVYVAFRFRRGSFHRRLCLCLSAGQVKEFSLWADIDEVVGIWYLGGRL